MPIVLYYTNVNMIDFPLLVCCTVNLKYEVLKKKVFKNIENCRTTYFLFIEIEN
jgi:hypothetical protein